MDGTRHYVEARRGGWSATLGSKEVGVSMFLRVKLFLILCVCVVVGIAAAQEPVDQQAVQQQQPAPVPGAATAAPAKNDVSAGAMLPAGAAIRDLPIGPGDEGEMQIYGLPEMNRHFRVGAEGGIDLPLIGRVQVAGLTPAEAETLVEKKYIAGGFLKDPDISIYIKESVSQSITIMGEVNRPGTYSLSYARRLYDAFQVAGGLTLKAGDKVSISHQGDKTAVTYTLGNDPVKMATSNVELRSGDTIVVHTAGIVYVVGEVIRPGGFVLENGKEPTVSQIMAMAAGPTRLANMSHARVIRQTSTGLENKEVDLKKIMSAKANDFELKPNDILFIPTSGRKMALSMSSGSILQSLTTAAIYRF